MVLVEFTKDFANKKKGDRMKIDSMLASQLTRVDKVAKVVKEDEAKAPKAPKKGK